MRRFVLARSVAIVLALAAFSVLTALVTRLRFPVANSIRRDGSTLLFNGWGIKPVGAEIPLPGDMPLRMRFLDNGNRLAVATGGFHNHGLAIIDTRVDRLVDSISLRNTWAGLDVSGDRLVVSGGHGPCKIVRSGGPLTTERSFGYEDNRLGMQAPSDHCFAGVACRADRIWVADTQNDAILRFEGSPPRLVQQRKLGYRPYAVLLSPDGTTLAVGDWGNHEIFLIDPATLEVQKQIQVGSHPNDMVFGPDGRLFVANGGSNSVSVVKDEQVIETIVTSIDPDELLGSTPDALAISPDGSRLFVANADNNDVAVADISGPRSKVLGFIPTGWYPSSLAVSPDGRKLYVATAKGNRFRGSYPSQTAYNLENSLNAKAPKGPKFDYIGMMLDGNVNVIAVPNAAQLASYTAQVRRDIPRPTPPGPAQLAPLRKIHHVFYVIRENRTYDEIFGDLPQGNGEPALDILGRRITPNAHALAEGFILFDNLYCNGEVSNSGHDWCDSAYCTDFAERTWENRYSKHGNLTADTRLAISPNGYIWDACKAHNVSYRSYGERTDSAGLVGHTSATFEAAPKREQDGRDYQRVEIMLDEFRKSEAKGDWPSLTILALPEDHTFALAPGRFTPEAGVASNDLALGKLVDAVSHSRYWKDSAIFVIEDDTQAGPDHVDAHRTAGLLISPYVRRGIVDSRHYTTMSMVRTMELILGLPPLSQYDTNANVMIPCFADQPDLRPYTLRQELVSLNSRNPMTGDLARASERLDLSAEDRADPEEMNRILWRHFKPGIALPRLTRTESLSTATGDAD